MHFYPGRPTERMLPFGLWRMDGGGGLSRAYLNSAGLVRNAQSWVFENLEGFSPERQRVIEQRGSITLEDFVNLTEADLISNHFLPAAVLSTDIASDSGGSSTVTQPPVPTTPPTWATNLVSNLRQSLGINSSSSSTSSSSSSGSSSSQAAADQSIPDRIVLWLNSLGVHANIWVHGAHTTLTLREGETQAQLEQRVRDATTALRNSTDANQSTSIANGATATGFTAPTPGSRPQTEGTGSGVVRDPEQQRLAITNANGRANWPPYPARINNYGTDISVTGGSNRMAMEIDYSIAGTDLLSGVAARMQHINYFWEIFDVTGVTIPEDRERATQYGTAEAVGPGSGVANSLYNSLHANYEDQRADLETMADSGAMNIALWQVRAAQLSLMAISASVRTIGSLVSSYVSIVTSPLNERNFGWDREGEFIVRCVSNSCI